MGMLQATIQAVAETKVYQAPGPGWVSSAITHLLWSLLQLAGRPLPSSCFALGPLSWGPSRLGHLGRVPDESLQLAASKELPPTPELLLFLEGPPR